MASLQPQLCRALHNTRGRHDGQEKQNNMPLTFFFFKLSKFWNLFPYNEGVIGALNFTDIGDRANPGI